MGIFFLLLVGDGFHLKKTSGSWVLEDLDSFSSQIHDVRASGKANANRAGWVYDLILSAELAWCAFWPVLDGVPLFWRGRSLDGRMEHAIGNRRLKCMGLMQGISIKKTLSLWDSWIWFIFRTSSFQQLFSSVVKAVELLSTSAISMRTRVASFGLFHCHVSFMSMSQLSHGYADMNPHWCALSPLSSCWSPSILQRALGGKAWWKGIGGIPQLEPAYVSV